MRTTSFLPVIILTSCVLFGACDKNCVKPSGIYGEWLWEESISAGSPPVTPATEGYDITLIIDDFTSRSYTDDVLKFESQYDLVIRQDSTDNETYLVFPPSGYELGIYISASTLILYDFNVTHFIKSTYRRK